MDSEPVSWVEFDVDGCSRTFGVAPCTAALSVLVKRKCYNTFATCRDRPNFDRIAQFRTLRFCQPRSNMPKGATYFPALVSISEQSSTVNIAGSDDDMSALGRRATVRVGLVDFPYHDRLTDPYQSERVSGTAQNDEPGYDPGERGTFFARLKRRWPYYAGRPFRVINAQITGGVLTNLVTRHYVITDMTGPDDDGRVSFEASDILDLAKNEKAVAPKPSNGALFSNIGAGLPESFTLQPTGIGNSEYPASGRALIGSEIVAYTRVGDVVTLATRGVAKSLAATHSAGDTFQQVLYVNLSRVDTLIRTLLVDYAGVTPAFVPTAKWTAEISRWLPDLLLEAHIVKPTGVSTLIGELSILGISVWWDSALQEIGLKANRPPAEDVVYALSDDANIKAISVEDRDEKRLTQIHFASVMSDPTKSNTSKENYDRLFVTPDLAQERAEAFGGARIREVLCRWLNQGNNDLIRTLSQRLLARFKTSPQHFTILLDAKDTAIGLTDVLQVTTRSAQNETGKPEVQLLQVIERSEPQPGHEIRIVAQAYQFSLRFALIGPDSLPVYSAATAQQRRTYGFIGADIEPAFTDGSDYYRIV